MISQKLIDKGIYWSKAWSLVESCTPCSEGCVNCWLAEMDYRFAKGNARITENKTFFYKPAHFREDRLNILQKSKKPQVFAVWSDLYHLEIPIIRQYQAYLAMNLFPRHTYLILTKRAERMAQQVPKILKVVFQSDRFPEHIWHGVTCESQQRANERIPYLLQVPGKRFLSLEPLLSEIDLHKYIWKHFEGHSTGINNIAWAEKGDIDAVIVGAESGPHRRPCSIEWIRSVVQQTQKANIKIFVKQIQNRNGKVIRDINEFPEDLRIRELAWG